MPWAGGGDRAMSSRSADRPCWVCTELPSLHVQPPPHDTQQAVAHALFADACAAAGVDRALITEPTSATVRIEGSNCTRLIARHSDLILDKGVMSRGAVTSRRRRQRGKTRPWIYDFDRSSPRSA